MEKKVGKEEDMGEREKKEKKMWQLYKKEV